MTDLSLEELAKAIAEAEPVKLPRDPNWYQDCLTGSRGDVLSNLANALLALRRDPAWDGVLGYDDMRYTAMLLKPLPGKTRLGWVARPIEDADVSVAQEWLQIAGLPHVSRDTVHQAVDLVAKENRFHPVRDYLEGLIWDGMPRIDGSTGRGGDIVPPWLAVYAGAADNDYTRAVGRMFLVSMVARIFRPGCQVDHMLVLEGAQGKRKSSLCGVLGGDFFSEAMTGDLSSKDAQQHLKGKWLVEFAELNALSRADVREIKAFVSRRVEVYRPSYGRREVHEPRQCVFIGTTNKEQYLRDETGGRRFWPVKIGLGGEACRVDDLARDRDQLFAEAVHLYRSGAKWWADSDFERQHIAPEQEARYEDDAWEEQIAGFLAGTYPPLADGEQAKPLDRVTVFEVGKKALHIDTPRLGTAEQRRISAALERLAFQRGKRGPKGEKFWCRVGE